MTTDHDRYASIAQQYQRAIDHNLTVSRIERQLMEPLHAVFTTARRVLDVGSGEGSCLHYVARKYPRISQLFGVDNSPTMIGLSQRKNASQRVRFVLGDMSDLPFDEEFFDVVYARFAVHHSTDLKKTLREVARVTTKGGTFLIRDAHPICGLFLKPSHNYTEKESAEFPAWHDQSIMIKHPCFTLEEYFDAIHEGGWIMAKLSEHCGSHSTDAKFAPFRIPTTITFKLLRPS